MFEIFRTFDRLPRGFFLLQLAYLGADILSVFIDKGVVEETYRTDSDGTTAAAYTLTEK